jgi:hypothetical protein
MEQVAIVVDAATKQIVLPNADELGDHQLRSDQSVKPGCLLNERAHSLQHCLSL